MATAGTLLVDIGANVARLQSDMRRVEGTMHSSFGKIEARAKQMSRLVSGSITGFIAGFGIKEFVGTLAEFDKLNASLKTVTGSIEAAGRAGETLRRFSAQTPFELNEVTAAFIRLKSLGLDASEEALRSMGNTASAMSKPLVQFVEAVADAATGEFERLKEFGIKASKEGERVTFTFQGMRTTIRNDSAAIQKYLLDLGNTQFASGMKDQMDTIGGAASNMKDAFANLVDFIGNLGIRDAIKSSFSGVAEYINAITQQMNEAFGSGLDRDIAVTLRRIDEVKSKMENARSIASATGGLMGTGAVEESARQLDALNYRLEILQKQKSELAKPVNIAPPKIEAFQATTAKVHEDMRKVKATGVEITSVFEEWYDRIGQFRDGIGGVNGMLEQTKVNADELTDVFEELRNKRLDEEVINPKALDETTKSTDKLDSAARELGLTFQSAFEDSVVEGKKFKDVLKGIEQDLIRIATRKLITEPFIDLLDEFMGGGQPDNNQPNKPNKQKPSGGSTDWLYKIGDVSGQAWDWLASFFHNGGVVGSTPTFSRPIPALAFAGAPRYHSGGIAGLRPDEVPAILQKGEVVLPRGAGVKNGGGGGVDIQIIDQRGSGAPVEAQRQTGPDGREQIKLFVRDEVKSLIASGYLDKSMSAAYGARRTGVTR